MPPLPGSLIWGPLLDGAPAALSLPVALCALRPALIPKGQVGRHHRAVSRNGRVLLASALPVDALVGRRVQLRVAPWHRRLLPADPLTVHGVLLCAWAEPSEPEPQCYRAALAGEPLPGGALFLDLGGLRVLTLLPPPG
jgi:hypothetical protein